MMNKPKTIEDELYALGLWVIGFGIIGVTLYFQIIEPLLPKNSCVFWKVLGLYCPGCGGTRAVQALFHGRFLTSLWYHPLVLYTVVVFGGFMLTNTMQRLNILHIKGWKFHEWHLFGALILIICNWILKNVLLLGFNISL